MSKPAPEATRYAAGHLPHIRKRRFVADFNQAGELARRIADKLFVGLLAAKTRWCGHVGVTQKGDLDNSGHGRNWRRFWLSRVSPTRSVHRTQYRISSGIRGIHLETSVCCDAAPDCQCSG